jgi:hypothetical protein
MHEILARPRKLDSAIRNNGANDVQRRRTFQRRSSRNREQLNAVAPDTPRRFGDVQRNRARCAAKLIAEAREAFGESIGGGW